MRGLNSKWSWLACVLGLICAAQANPALASVAGQGFAGQMTNSDGDTFAAAINFSNDNDGATFTQQFPNQDPTTFYGTYDVNFDIVIISSFTGTFQDGSPDGEFTVDGIVLLNIITFATLTNDDVDISAAGVLVNQKYTPQAKSKKKPGSKSQHGSTIGGAK